MHKHPTSKGPGTAVREQAGKLPYHLIPPEFNVFMALVLQYGANKYAARNFEKGLPMEDLLRGAEAHLTKLKMGELLDGESGLPHAVHAAWNLLTFAMQGARAPTTAAEFAADTIKRRGVAPMERAMTTDLRALWDAQLNGGEAQWR
jgi:Domain of unknown function (DUF5664)